MLKTEELKLVSEWDKTFPQSEKVDHQKVTFVNRYGITLAADLYKPKNVSFQMKQGWEAAFLLTHLPTARIPR